MKKVDSKKQLLLLRKWRYFRWFRKYNAFFIEELLKTPPINLTIVTNSLYVINTVVQHPEVKLVVLGGYFQYSTMNFLDLEINPFFDRYHVNKAFMGVNGIDEIGYYSSTLLEAETKKTIMQTSPMIYILASSSKIFKKSLVSYKPMARKRILSLLVQKTKVT